MEPGTVEGAAGSMGREDEIWSASYGPGGPLHENKVGVLPSKQGNARLGAANKSVVKVFAVECRSGALRI
jgi:hypothetical protein